MSRARKWSSKRPALVKHYLLEKCQHFYWIKKGEKTQYNLRNFWLFNPKSEELLISLLCPKVCHQQYCSYSTTNTNRLFKLEMIHFYLFIFSLFLKVGENAVGLCVPRLLVPTGRRPSQRLQTSPYTRSELLWQPQVFLKLGLKFICVWQQKLKRKTRMIMCQESPPGEDLESLWETNQDADLQCLCRLPFHCWLSQHHRQVRVHLKNDWCVQG